MELPISDVYMASVSYPAVQNLPILLRVFFPALLINYVVSAFPENVFRVSFFGVALPLSLHFLVSVLSPSISNLPI